MGIGRICKVGAILWFLGAALPEARGASWQEEIPFKLTRGFGIVVRGGIGPVNDLNLLFDTGAVPSVISQRLASRIGVSGAVGSLALVEKQIQAQYATITDVRFGAIHAATLPVVVDRSGPA